MATMRLVSVIILSCLLTSCASNETTSSVLEPVDEKTETSEPAKAPSFEKLNAQLTQLGYQGVGLDYESEETLSFLLQVFQDPKVAGRNIRLVYTGLKMAYDAEQSSLTVGGVTQVSMAVDFISKKVPKKPQ